MASTTTLRSVFLAAITVAGAGCGGGSSLPTVQYLRSTGPAQLPPLEAIPTDPLAQAYTEKRGFAEYIIGPADEVVITLRGVVVTKETVSVRPDGYISFSLVENIRAAGLTPTELDSSITAELGRFLRTPKIDVEVVEFRSKIVSLIGSLQTLPGASATKSGQGRYPLKKRTTVLDLILEAGGATPDAQLERVRLLRGGKTYPLDLQRVLNSGEKTHNVVLQGGDIVIVPGTNLRSKKVIVLGQVGRPSVYMFAEGARLLEALSQAGGFTGSAQREDIRVIRVVDGEAGMFRLDFNRLTAGGSLDDNVLLQNDDIIYVPRSFMGDVNDVITKIEPLLGILLLPATYRDLYTTGGGLRIDTGEAEGSTSGFIRTLPGTAAGKKTTSDSGDEEPADDGDEGD